LAHGDGHLREGDGQTLRAKRAKITAVMGWMNGSVIVKMKTVGELESKKNANNIPLFFDCVVWDTWPNHTEGPPDIDGIVSNEMHLVCINRHKGYINTVFVDLNVRRVGLKEIWTLDWHRNFNTEGIWTTAGGAVASDWPVWMRNFKEF
jgi:prepilin-type processing-associated H-X9-DG protein